MCDHPRELWFKCATARKDATCVQCLLCFVEAPAEGNCMLTLVEDKAEYAKLPEIPQEAWLALGRIAMQARSLRTIRGELETAVK